MTTWDEHVAAWSRPPVDDVGYIPSADMLTWSDAKLSATIADMRRTRYNGWRNHGGLWREMLKLDETHNADILDFGCGVGLEALELRDAGNRVQLADISAENLALALRVLNFSQYPPEVVTCHLVGDQEPYFHADRASFDAVHCAGVLHHIRWPRGIMQRFHDILRPGGEVRLMVYSDYGWCQATGTTQLPHWSMDSEQHPGFEAFVSFMDGTGTYADWYNREKLEMRFGDLFSVDDFAYITEDLRYCCAVLTRKGLT